MEEKKMNNGVHVSDTPEDNMATGNITQQPEQHEIDEVAILKSENEQLQKKYTSEKKSCLRYYRQMTMLKNAINKLTEEGKITEVEVMQAVLAGQSMTSLDDLLFALAD